LINDSLISGSPGFRQFDYIPGAAVANLIMMILSLGCPDVLELERFAGFTARPAVGIC